jgi:hypothetical protein
MILNHPIYKKAYLHHEIGQATESFCKLRQVDNVIIQINLKVDRVIIIIKTSSSSEATVLKLSQNQLFETIEQVLTEKKLWEGKSLELQVKLK